MFLNDVFITLNGVLTTRAECVCSHMTLTGVTVGPCYLFHLPQRSRNGPKIEILRAKIYATPSKNICLGHVLN